MNVYLAAPYSAPTPEQREARFVSVCKVAAAIMRAGHIVFSPISHSHPISIGLDNSLEHDFWLKQDFGFFDWADELWIYCADGWTTSKGIKAEIEEWQARGKGRIRYFTDDDIESIPRGV